MTRTSFPPERRVVVRRKETTAAPKPSAHASVSIRTSG